MRISSSKEKTENIANDKYVYIHSFNQATHNRVAFFSVKTYTTEYLTV